MDDPRFLLLYGVLTLVGVASIRKALYDRQTSNIPVIGSTGFLSSYRDGLNFLVKAPELVQQGYDQYPDGVFRIARPYRWDYVVSGTKLVKEIANAPEDALSFHEGVGDLIQCILFRPSCCQLSKINQFLANITIGHELTENHHLLINVVRTTLTRNLHARFPDVGDEIIHAFEDVLQLTGSEWKTIHVLPTVMAIVSRVSNRLFVGLPLCRNREYLENNVKFAVNVIQSGQTINLFPPLLRPLVGWWVTSKNQNTDIAMGILGPMIEERLAKDDELGPNWPDRPNDFISWLLDSAEGSDRQVRTLVGRVLQVNMAAIHTSSMAFTHALYNLTTYPEHILPMREEAERMVRQDGWTKNALNNMHKIDSFLRETQRFNGVGPMLMLRRVVAKNGFRLSTGAVLPYGSFVCVAARATHSDPANYENPNNFDGFRFAREREAQAANADPDKDIFKRHMISTAPDHLPFGTGKHACPGRFFASTELKAMLAHVVMNYDVKAEVDGVRPQNKEFAGRVSPNPKGKVLFRKRQ
ncbi:cytochrome P450 [Mycena pura]|uniref:Cytochrome P450 n=1 Tax=Mycena pura TaxID=153505 RepID=A0AAD6V1J9_9AGAR|nr:cytochrome P450 [Mycena pura]